MEASEQSQPGQADEVSGTQDPNSPADSQEQPTQDSQLTTPQPNQPAEGTVQPAQYPSGAEQQAAEDQRQAELQAQRDVHNKRAAAGVPRPTEAEVQATRQDAERATAEEQAEQDQA